MRYPILICLLFMLSCTVLFGQNNFFKQPAITLSFYNHSVGVPFKDYFKTPMNFGFTLGAEFAYDDALNAKHFQRLEVGWYHHKNLNTAVYLKSDFVRRIYTKMGVYADLQGGLGYIHDFSNYQTFVPNGDGVYEKKNKSNGGLLVGFGAALGYQFEVEDKYAFAPYLRYEGMLQIPYAKLLPFFPHSLLHVGARFKMR